MITYQLDFNSDWKLWNNFCNKFSLDNGYFVLDELPGYLRATEPLLYDIRIVGNKNPKMVLHNWAELDFKTDQDKVAFLLKWL